jgi:anti-anti-sigma factor
VNVLAVVEAAELAGSSLVRVSGEIDLSNAHDVMDSISEAVPHDARRVVLDLSATAYLDSSGIAMLFRLAERLAHRRQELRVVVPDDSPIRAVLELTDVPRVVAVRATVAEAAEPA